METMVGATDGFAIDLDRRGRTLKLRRRRQAGAPAADFTFAEPGPDMLALDGRLDGRKARMTLSRMPLNTTQRFHWLFIAPEEDR